MKTHHRRLRVQAGLAVVMALAAAPVGATVWSSTATRAMSFEGAAQHGLLAAGEPVHVVVSLRLRNGDDLNRFTTALLRPGSPSYGRFLSARQFLDRYAPTQAQADAVAAHLRSAGFVNVDIAANRLLVSADGTAGTVRKAFNTELASFELDGRRGYANLRDAQVPGRLKGVVLSVLGLQTMDRFSSQARIAPQAPAVQATKRGFNPTEFPKLYGLNSTPTASQTTVGIITQGDMSQTVADLHQFESQNALPTINPMIVNIGNASSDTSGTIEWDLDSQDIQAMAGGSLQDMIFYTANTLSNANITSAYNRAVSDNTAKLINVSLGECETSAQSDGTMAADDQIFQTAIAQGQIFSVSSGDSGSHECRALFKYRGNAKQSYPASSPYVVAVGGTSVYADANGNWSSETAWSGSGGGPSTIESQPSWQNGVVSGSARGVPDVALAADPSTGAVIVYKGGSQQVGGTSLASPLFVGMWARFESANGNGLVFPNPGLYQYLPANGNLIHDVTSGSNGGFNPYTAGSGWDYVTGFGSPVGDALGGFVGSHSGF